MGVIWKDIPSYEGIYQVSNDGRVRTVEGKMTTSIRHGERHWHSRILKTKDTWAKHHTVWCGERVTLWKDKKPKDYLVHRLEACAFWGYPLDSELTVNHKDGNRRNNSIDNLEMISRADNIRHGFDNGLYSSARPMSLVDNEGNTYNFRSISKMNEFLGLHSATHHKSDIAISSNGTVYKIER